MLRYLLLLIVLLVPISGVMAQDSAATNIAPGQQTLTASVTVSFELE